ncbi:amino acid adenylation domain-containing protein [Candidatus Poribacteria bacterium]|nr:amino acid adenylation domain-containing protein [Candidatus Poribacteria bacterium]
MSDLKERIAKLSPEKRALLEKLLMEKEAGKKEEQKIPKRETSEPCLLSFAQQRLWFLDQLQPQNPMYNIPLAIRMKGQLDRDTLSKTLNAILQRHEALRTRFESIDGNPVQVISEDQSLEIMPVDLSKNPDEEKEDALQKFLRRDILRPFDLSKDLMIRSTLVKMDDDEHVLLIVMHHIASDGWSMGVFWREFVELYRALSSGNDSSLPELPVQYADFALWQREWLKGDNMEKQLSYWREQLKGIPPILELPTDHPRPAMLDYWGERHPFAISHQLAESLKTLSRKHGGTLFMTLLTAYSVLLYRYTNQDDIVVGSPIANRNRIEIENLIGFFVNTLVMRTDLSRDPSFIELLAEVKNTALEAYAHQDLPFEKLVEELEPQRNLSHNPLFQVVFVLQNTPRRKVELPHLTISPQKIETVTAKFDLTLSMTETDDGMSGFLEFNTDLFDSDTIVRMTGHFKNLLQSIAANPEQRVSEIPILTEAERQQVLTEWNNIETVYPKDTCIHSLFEKRMKDDPNAIVLTYQDQQVTYSQLNEKANQLAHYLVSLGVGPEVLVGMYIERSIDMVTAILAILKAGGAYVPMDPVYPPDRLAFMIEDAEVPVIITQDSLVGQLPEHKAHVICMDTDRDKWSEQSKENPECDVKAHNVAYVIYTSGSTGKPKGVLVQHFNIVRLFQATDHWYNFNKDDVWTLFHSYAFDFSVWEIWGALIYGGRLVVVPYMISRSPGDFYELLCREKVTVLNQTPSAFRQLIRAEGEQGEIGQLSLRYVIFGGEALEFNSLQPWFERHGDKQPQLINMYGITETTVHVTYYQVTMKDIEKSRGSIIGVPIPDLQVYILDKNMEPVPVGVTGEMYVGGGGVARGYLKRPELNAERFIQDIFNSDPNAKLYKSGDLARYLSDGNMEYIGRGDQQVKIRGFRIELGEIESNLAQHPSIQENVVIARESGSGDKQLVAYFVPKEDKIPTINDLRNHLKSSLPDYMIPTVFVSLVSIPLTANGKVNRRALPAPDQDRPNLEQEFVGPGNEVEKQLIRIWEEALNVSPIGIKDNFFEIGGHSLLAVQVFSQIQKAFGKNLPLTTLFQSPTIEQLAREIGHEEDKTDRFSIVVPLRDKGSKRPFFAIHGCGGEILIFKDIARHIGSDQPFYAIRSRGLYAERPPLATVPAMAAVYIREIRKIQPEGPYFIGSAGDGGVIALEIAHQLMRQGQKVGLMVMLDIVFSKRPWKDNPEQWQRMVEAYNNPGVRISSNPTGESKARKKSPFHYINRLGYYIKSGQMIDLVKSLWEQFYWNRVAYGFVPKYASYLQHRIDYIKRTRRIIGRATHSYMPKPYPGKITYIPSGPLRNYYREDLKALAQGGVEVHNFHGLHSEMWRDPNARAVAEIMRECFAKAEAEIEKDHHD